MFEAQYLFANNAVYSPWMSRQGDNMIITVDLIDVNSSTIKIEVFQKNSEVPGDGTAHPDGFLTTSTTSTPQSKTYTEMEELVRYKITGGGTAGSANRILFRMLSPVWYDDVKA